jgi:hypothetical protein
MKATFSRILAIIAIGLITACVSTLPASAQDAFKGSFTLPEDVRWGQANLPAGHYTFSLKSQGLPAQIIVTGPNGSSFVMTSSTDKKNMNEPSNLKIQRNGATRFVKEIYLADLQLQLNYHAPSMPKGEQQLAMGPVSTEQIQIAMAK